MLINIVLAIIIIKKYYSTLDSSKCLLYYWLTFRKIPSVSFQIFFAPLKALKSCSWLTIQKLSMIFPSWKFCWAQDLTLNIPQSFLYVIFYTINLAILIGTCMLHQRYEWYKIAWYYLTRRNTRDQYSFCSCSFAPYWPNWLKNAYITNLEL